MIQQALNSVEQDIYAYAERKIFSIIRRPDEDKLSFIADYNKLDEPERSRAKKYITLDVVQHLYMLTKCIEKGVKILKSNSLDFRLLELTDLNINIADYNQPFESVVLQLPDDYSKERHFATGLEPGRIIHPNCMLITHLKELEIILVDLLGTTDFCGGITLNKTNITIEEELQSKINIHGPQGNFWEIVRAGLNACLILDEYGIKRIGPENPSYYARLQRQLERAQRLHDQGAERTTRRAMRGHPTVYNFDSEVILMNKEVLISESVSREKEGHKNKPHWRRGHYRMQVHGPKNTLRKRIRVPPCFINSHLFTGNMLDAVRIYKEK